MVFHLNLNLLELIGELLIMANYSDIFPLTQQSSGGFSLISTVDIRAPGAFNNTLFTGQTINLTLIQVTPQARGF